MNALSSFRAAKTARILRLRNLSGQLLLLLIFISVSHPAAAGDVRLGGEVPLGTPVLVPAAGSRLVSVASNGTDFLALWNGACVTCDPSSPGALYIGRVDATGHPVHPVGHKLYDDDHFGATLVFNGTTPYAIVTPPDGHTFFQPLDRDGKPSGVSIDAPLADFPVSAASNGRNIALIHVNTGGGADLSLFNFDGTRVDATVVPQFESLARLFTLPNGDYGVVSAHTICPGNQPCTSVAELLTMDGTTATVTQHILFNDPQATLTAGNADGAGHILVTWLRGDGTASYEIVDASGNVVVPAAALPGRFDFFMPPAAGWDGREFLIVLATDKLTGWRVSASGQLVQPAIDLGAKGDAAQIASGPAGQFIAWDASPGLFGRVAATFADLPAATTNVLAQSAALQTRPHLATGWIPYATWMEGNDTIIANGSPVGGTASVLVPSAVLDVAIARGRDSYLVVWIDNRDASAFRVLGKRIALDGSRMDTNPIVIATGQQSSSYPDIAFAVGSNGSDFLVVWDEENRGLSGARVSAAGSVLDPQPIVIGHVTNTWIISQSPHVVWTGSRYLVAFLNVIECSCLISPPPPPVVTIRVASVSAAGQVLDAGETPQIGPTNNGSDIALAASGKGTLLLYSIIGFAPAQTCLYSTLLADDGTQNGTALEIGCGPGSSYPPALNNPDVAWDGTEYVAVWADSSTFNVDALRFASNGVPIDSAPFAVNPTGTKAAQPAVAASANGATIAYIRLTDEIPYGGVARVFARTLDRIGAIGRGRAVR